MLGKSSIEIVNSNINMAKVTVTLLNFRISFPNLSKKENLKEHTCRAEHQ